MKRKILLAFLTLTMFSFVGCSKEESFEDKVVRKFTYVDSAQRQLEATVEDLASQVAILRSEIGISDVSKYKEDDINFSSIKVSGPSAVSAGGSAILKADDKFNLSIDVLNSTDENISQFICQAYLTYKMNGEYYDRHLVDTRFDILPKSVRKQIEFKDIPTKGVDVEHVLTVIIKDVNGNEITKFEKKLNVK